MFMRNRPIRNKNERGITLFIGILSMLFIIPMVGLVIDVGFLYAVKSKLQSAVDGAALAAARALVIGQTTAAQATSAQAHAVNWFYANLPSSYFGIKNTVMSTSNVQVFDDANNSHIRNVTVTGTTQVDTFFMKWFGFDATTVASTGNAARRDVVIMMIMDRSGSMNSNNGCSNMRSAAKLFTGQFSAGRDRLGMVEFGDTSWVDTAPTTNFQTVLGYNNDLGNSAGLIDTILCGDNTGSAQAISLAYNELYRANQIGAMNVLMFFTDGIPNSVTVNLKNVMLATSNCKDSTGLALSSGGNMATHPQNWTPGWTLPSGSYFSNIPAGPIGVVASDDPNNSGTYGVRTYAGVSQGNVNHGVIAGDSAQASGCSFPADSVQFVKDFQKLPPTDVWGNNLVNNAYNPVTTDGSGNVVLNGTAQYNGVATPMTGNNLTFHYVARNAADSAAFNARTNGTIPAYIFGVGLGGTTANPPGYDFMQRLTNDPNGDLFNKPPLYGACSTELLCTTHSDQPQGAFIFSSTPSQLQEVFLRMASMILRLSK
jgi:Flp pilus assembly protein TadG